MLLFSVYARPSLCNLLLSCFERCVPLSVSLINTLCAVLECVISGTGVSIFFSYDPSSWEQLVVVVLQSSIIASNRLPDHVRFHEMLGVFGTQL